MLLVHIYIYIYIYICMSNRKRESVQVSMSGLKRFTPDYVNMQDHVSVSHKGKGKEPIPAKLLLFFY